jgi:hypothetical protein
MNLRHHQVDQVMLLSMVDLLVPLLVVPYPYLVLIDLAWFLVIVVVPMLPVVLAPASVQT